ncbi:metallophosphoesterase [Bradyrhizobium sp. AUGA SZCCT0177]|uniref:metallophosphoesterase n=1 Tax=unclassified Bradyrhizobium TaxID=2631580 RepID=UPI001BA82725|nr:MULTISPECIES: metallophosphoesterase [unclassified Bradyrhizobium]MBR1237134.1 metallophosphoesterase [Bradyrhizobium sp. AUGA SZCCT0182]MBR1281436.1 metallophosphoesterase [Bradyrhizobium sp. AUGA SZCCT0177]
MKIQIFSDLHIDVYPIKPITVVPGVDLVIVAGDVCEGLLRAFEHLRRIVPMDIPIVMVPGNHEYYRRFIPDELALALAHAGAFNLHILNGTALELSGVRFAGATLWTDYRIMGEANQARVMNACAKGMNDHRLIGWQKKPWRRFRPQEAALLHHRSKAAITETLAAPFAGPTVVVSHHAVHWDSIHPRFRSDLVTGAFVSDLSELIETYQPTLWVHGHVHNSSDYLVGKTRVLCNPHGYGTENATFDGALVVEVGE